MILACLQGFQLTAQLVGIERSQRHLQIFWFERGSWVRCVWRALHRQKRQQEIYAPQVCDRSARDYCCGNDIKGLLAAAPVVGLMVDVDVSGKEQLIYYWRLLDATGVPFKNNIFGGLIDIAKADADSIELANRRLRIFLKPMESRTKRLWPFVVTELRS
jgi:hypothetical protein